MNVTTKEYFNLKSLRELLKDPAVCWLGRVHLIEQIKIFNNEPWGSAASPMTKEEALKKYGALRAHYEEINDDDCIRKHIYVFVPYDLDSFGQDTVRDASKVCSCGHAIVNDCRCTNAYCSNYFFIKGGE